MKIAILSKSCSLGGGASRVAENLTLWLRATGYEADLVVADPMGSTAEHVKPLFGQKTPLYLSRIALSEKLFRAPLIPFDIWMGAESRLAEYDIVHLHDHWRVFSPRFIARLAAQKRPLFWTFHDCSPFTGGCMYPMDCQRFQHTCGACPQMGRRRRYTGRDFSRLIRRERSRQFPHQQLYISTPSKWMAHMATSSGLTAAPIEVIPYGVDTTVFRPVPRATVREELGLPLGRTLVLVSAHILSPHNDRKGVRDSLHALRRSADLSPLVVLIGDNSKCPSDFWQGLDTVATGHINDPEMLAKWYAACDIFLFPSKSDNFPMAVLETMACGVPTIAYDTGGVSEQVAHNSTGWLCAAGDVKTLSLLLRDALQQSNSNNMENAKKQARQRVLDAFRHDVFANRYVTGYQRCLRN